MATHYYFAYGSNMAEAVFHDRVEGVAVGCGVLRGYRLSFSLPSQRWGGHAADIAALDGAEVWGRIWQIGEDQLPVLDVVERKYHRREVSVDLMVADDEGSRPEQVRAMTYVVRDDMRAAEEGAPAADYLDHILAGAEECGLPDHYVRFLREVSTSGP